jgi:hypothetical protein
LVVHTTLRNQSIPESGMYKLADLNEDIAALARALLCLHDRSF